MNITNCTRKWLLIVSISIAFTSFTTHADTTQPQDTDETIAYSTELHTILDTILRQELEMMRQTDCIIESILLSIRAGSITITNKQEFKDNADAIRDLIKSLTGSAFLQVDAMSIHQLSFLNRAIIQHLLDALKNNLTDLPAFNLETAFTRYQPIDLTLEDLQQGIMQNQTLLQSLEKKAEVAGLTKWNKFYREFNHYVLKPAQKYHIPHYTGLTAKTALWGTIALYSLQNAIGLSPKSPYRIGTLLTYLGVPPILTGGTALAHEHEGQLKLPGKMDYEMWRFTAGYMPLATLTYSWIKDPFKNEYNDLKSYLSQKLLRFHNWSLGGAFAHKQAAKEDNNTVNPRVMFKDLVGLEYAKDVLGEIVTYLENPERFESRKIAPRKGYLLTGPTRTGKSHIVEALAGEIKAMYKRTGRSMRDFNFYTLPGEVLMNKGIRAYIEEAKTLAPCILFIDEIDLLGLQRAGGDKNLLTQFLEAMSGALQADPDKVVIMIAATNRPENLDVALRQEGRYGKEIRFEYPSFQYRKDYLSRRIGAITNLNLFNLEKLSYETEGLSFESLNMLVNNASYKATIRNQSLSQELLEKTLDEEIHNIIMNDQLDLSDAERKIIAVHQAGHALAMILLNSKEKLARATIRPYLTELEEKTVWDQYSEQKQKSSNKKIVYGKLFTYHEKDTRNIVSYEEQLEQCKITLAGHIAEEIIYGKSGYSYHKEDAQNAFDLAKLLAARGLDFNQFSDSIKTGYLNDAFAIKKQCEQEIHALLAQHKDKLIAIVDALCLHKSLSGQEVAKLAGIDNYGTPTKKSEVTELTQNIKHDDLDDIIEKK